MKKRQHFNEDRCGGEMTVEFTVCTGTVRAIGTGFWSVRQVNAFFADWVLIIRQIHAAHKAVSALVDLSAGCVQKAEVIDIIANATTGLYCNRDAVAMLVATNLAKMQMRRVHDPAYHGFFISRSAAETWLQAKALPNGTLRADLHAAA